MKERPQLQSDPYKNYQKDISENFGTDLQVIHGVDLMDHSILNESVKNCPVKFSGKLPASFK